MSKTLKAALYQGFHGIGVPEPIVRRLQAEDIDLFCLPEYFMVGQGDESILPSAALHDKYLGYLVDLSIKLNCVLTGSSLVTFESGEYKNRCYFINRGMVVGYYDKIHLYKNEGKGQVVPGVEYKLFEAAGLRIGLLVCADVLYPWSFENISGLKPDLLVVPVTSPYREGETAEAKFKRDQELFIAGARAADCPIIKVGSVGKIAGHRLQGRSLVATSEGITFRVAPDDEDQPVLKIIDLTL